MSSRAPVGARVLAAVLLAGAGACGGGGGYGSPPTTTPPTTLAGPPADVVITVAGIAGSMSYAPSPATARVGQTVAWRNADSLPHTASQTGAGGFDTGTIAVGATSAPIRMSAAGSLDYFCRVHPAMTGKLEVVP